MYPERAPQPCITRPSRRLPRLLLALMTAVAGPVLAHHGTAVSYEQSNWITVKGTVTEFRWRNPHSALFLDTEWNGAKVNYAIELPSPVLMSRSNGWTRATFKPGDVVEFRVHPSRTGAAVGECLFDCLVYVNGELLPSRLPNGETRQ
ncbi:MAG: DUF6152 family protein [Pseudohongiellaceae bacterium]|jgi:hypothetical protein